MRRIIPWLGSLAALALFSYSLWALHHQLLEVHFDDVLSSFSRLGAHKISVACGFVLTSYFLLSVLDWIAFRGVSPGVAYSRIAPAAFCGYAVSYTLGFSAVTGSAVRFRLLESMQLDGATLAGGLARAYAFFWLGSALCLGFVLLSHGPSLHIHAASSLLLFQTLGAILVAFVLVTVLICLFRNRIQVATFELPLPSGRDLIPAIALAALDWIVCAALLHSLLPHLGLPFTQFLAIFVFAQLAGVISHVPGGLGVFEGMLIGSLGSHGHLPSVVSALAVFRLLYYILPLLLAGMIVLLHEWKVTQIVRPVAGASAKFIASFVPESLAIFTFLSGMVLLTSGATPGLDERMAWINTLVPLPLIEASHFSASLFGLSLLILARGLWLRIRIAYVLGIALLILGAIASLLKGFDYEEALILSFGAILLFGARKRFHRTENLALFVADPLWLIFALGALAGTTWLMFFAHKHVEYANELWWQFELDAHASRALRAIAGAAVLLTALTLRAVFSPSRHLADGASTQELDRLLPVVRQSSQPLAWLALLGDKSILFSESGRSFIMYGAQGGSLIALGDPVGIPAEQSELCWKFLELADEHGLRPVFYQVGPHHLSTYVDLGLTLLKLGEEATVNLPDFTMEGAGRKSQRNLLRRMESEGVVTEILPAELVPTILPELRAISDKWLQHKSVKEKGFSLGRFLPEYLTATPCAVVKHGGKICAFANLWLSGSKSSFSMDLMRYDDSAPKSIMEYLFLKLILWGKDNGYRNFNLGMAPLSGMERHPLAPLWHRIGARVYQHGENFYNFQGLRAFKEKFDPLWEPRYLASPGGTALIRTLANVTSRISGGFRGAFSK